MNQKKITAARKMLINYLRQCADEKGISINDIADRTGLHQSAVSRFFSASPSPTLDSLILIGDAVGVYFFIADKTADSDAADMMRNRMRRAGDRN